MDFLPPALNQGEGAARLRAAPARARRGRLSIKTPMCRQTALHLGCRFHVHYIPRGRPLSVVFFCLPADDQSYRIAGELMSLVDLQWPTLGVNMVYKLQCHATDLHCSGGGGGGGGLRTSASAERRPAHYSTVQASDL